MRISKAKVAAVALAAVILSGCDANPLGPHHVITATDRHRLAVMRSDPIFRTAMPKTAYYTVGETWGVDSWRRGEVGARIYQKSSPTDTMSPLPVQAFVRTLLAGMRSRGWVVYYASCTFESLNANTPPGAPDGPTRWHNLVYAYRIYQGTSYWVEIYTDANNNNGTGFISDVDVTMISSASGEAPNLFPDHPAGIPVGSVCAAQTHRLSAPVTQGRPITVSPESDRSGTPSPGPADSLR